MPKESLHRPKPPPSNKELKQFNGLDLAEFGLCEQQSFQLGTRIKKKKKGGWKLVWSEIKSRGNKTQDSSPHWRRRRHWHLYFTQQLMGGCSRPGWPYPHKGWTWVPVAVSVITRRSVTRRQWGHLSSVVYNPLLSALSWVAVGLVAGFKVKQLKTGLKYGLNFGFWNWRYRTGRR